MARNNQTRKPIHNEMTDIRTRWIKTISFVLAGIVLSVDLGLAQEIQEYCFGETFNATCADDEVVVMETAHYGRMRTGRCLKDEYKIGCGADIVVYVDEICSGRRTCEIKIPDTDLHYKQPCEKEYMVYFEASYRCVKVATGDSPTCRGPHQPELTGPGGYIANSVTQLSNYGSTDCPWRIKVEESQKINITLNDFGVAERYGETSNLCQVYARIRERGMESDVTICGSMAREKGVYISDGNEVEIEIMKFPMEDNPPHFLLRYEAVGCGKPNIPRYSSVKRHGDRAEVTCNYTSQTWHIVCKDNVWIGKLDECNKQFKGTKDKHTTNGDTIGEPKTISYGLMVAIVSGVALGIVLGIALLTLVLYCHRRRNNNNSSYKSEELYIAQKDGRDQYTQQKVPLSTESGYGYSLTTAHHGHQHIDPNYKCSCNTTSYVPSYQSDKFSTRGLYEKPTLVRIQGYETQTGKTDVPFYHEFDSQTGGGIHHMTDIKNTGSMESDNVE